MATIANLNVILNLEDNAFQRGLQNSRDKLDSWGSSLRSIGTKMTAGVTVPVVAGMTKMVMGASELEQSIGATEQLWGDNADAIIAWSKTTSDSLGLSQNDTLTSMARYNAMLKDLEDGTGNVAVMSQELTERSADLSAMWGGSSIEASDALTSALRGNYEGLDKYNVNLTESMVSQEAMNVAIADGRDEVTEADKVQARYNLIMEQSANAQGQFARESDTTAGKLARLRARVSNLATSIGRLLLPYVNKLADWLGKLITWLEKTDDTTRKWVLGIAAAAAAMGPLLLVLGLLLPGLSALLAVFGFLLSPIGLVIAALVALVAVFRDDIIDAVQTAVEWFTDFVTSSQNVQDMVGNLVDAFDAFKAGDFGEAFAAVGRAAGNLWGAIREAVAQIDWGSIGQSLLDGLASLSSWVANWTLSVGIPTLTGWVVDVAGNVWGGIVSLAGWAWDNRAELGTILLNFAWGIAEGIQSAWDWLRGWIFGDGGGTGLAGDGTGGAAYGDPIELGQVLLGGIAWLMDELVTPVWTWLEDTGIPAMGESAVKLGDVTLKGINWLMDEAVDLATPLLEWVKEQIGGIDWSTVATTAGNAIRNAVRDGIQNAANLFAVLLSWVSDQVRGVDWNSVGSTFAEWLVTGIKGIVGLVGLAGWLLGQVLLAIVEVDWASVGSAFKTFLSSALTAIADFLTGFATTIYNEIVGELELVNWAGIGEKVTEWASDIWNGITDALQPIIDTAVDNLNWLIEQLNKIPGVDIPKIGGIEQIGTDADNAAQKVVSLQSSINSLTSGTLEFAPASGLWSDVYGNAQADPYDPTQGGVGQSFKPFDNLSATFDAVASAAGRASASITPVNTEMAALTGRTTDVTTFGNVATEKFTSTGNSAKSNLQPIGPLAAQMAAQLVGTAVPAFTQMNSVAQSTLSAMRGVVQSTFSAIASIVTSSTTQAASVARSQFTAMASSVTSQVNSMTSQVQGRFSAMQGATSASLNAMRGAAQSAASQLASALSSGAAQAASAVQSQIGRIPGIVASVGGSAAATAYSVGANISNSFANGMRSALGAIQSAAAQMVSAADQAIRAKAQIASPSLVFAGLGENIGAGFEQGIRSTIPDAARAAGDLVSVPGVPHIGADGARGNGQVIQIITLEPGKWKEFLANAEAGGTFARNFGGELAMMGGQG